MAAKTTDPTDEIPDGTILPEIQPVTPYSLTVISPDFGGSIDSQQMTVRTGAGVEHREVASSASKTIGETINEKPASEETTTAESPATTRKQYAGQVLAFSITIPISLNVS